MRRVSDVLEGMLIAQGMSAGPVGAGSADIVASAPGYGEEGQDPRHSPTAGEDSADLNSGKGRRPKPAPVQQGGQNRIGKGRGPILEVHTNPNMTDMAMRQTTHSPTRAAPRGVVSLMIIKGGKA